ncbi:MAG: PQQ-like beta-propeller repeat protein [Thermoleophilia bacterium]|nr:PQQ-like beta-propeller repeat protein [Thermoleophilia bacterium]
MRTVLLTAAALAAAAVPAAADTWPVPAHDPANTSRSSVVSAQRAALVAGWPLTGLPGTDLLVGPAGPELLTGTGSPLVLNANGTARARGSAVGLDAIGPDGHRYAFRNFGDQVAAYGAGGNLLWLSNRLDLGSEASERTIVPAPDGTVYVTGIEGVAALEGATGALRWVDPTGTDQTNALAVAPDGTAVYGRTGGTPGNAITARRPDGSLRWQVTVDGRINEIAIHTDGTIVVSQDRASASGGAALRAFTADGAPLWSVPTGLIAPGPPALGADGTAYAAAARGILRNDRIASTDTLLAVAPDGTVRWSLRGNWTTGRPVVGGDGLVYAGGSPLTAVRPDGTIAWRYPAPPALAPVAIGTDGTLFARGFLSSMFAFAAPGNPAALPVQAPPRRGLLSSAGLTPTFFRSAGAASLCTGVARCSPARPLNATIAVRVAREALIQLRVRRVPDGRLAARLDRRVQPGTTWLSTRDLGVVLPRGRAALAPGRYVLSVRAAAGRLRATARPIRFTVVAGATVAPAG